MAYIVHPTAAAPAMSHFIISMLLAVGFRLRPPVSYTTPLPTNTQGFLFFACLGLYSITENVGGSTLPWFTDSKPPMPSCLIFALLLRGQPNSDSSPARSPGRVLSGSHPPRSINC
ncbi:UNKNOWN [Stylonychia lemnae]|uniref:Uncharacterized protein n=1 Tax=Stylonychia lemnae TaxID=5949 RepID=A0A078A4T1_STYLE|nr:UNKNOWN [Stylonychia lemnae]|eukprot:CDW76565.1 UNKNOWN [Stylonychia lemnae]